MFIADSFYEDLDQDFATEMLKDDVVIQPKYHSEIAATRDDASSDIKEKKSRTSIPRVPTTESHWCRRYLCEERRHSIEEAETKPEEATPAAKKLAAEFCLTFRVCWMVFMFLKNLTVDGGFCNPHETDALGFVHNFELKLLGVPCFLGCDTTFDHAHAQTEIDAEVHRNFHHDWTRSIDSIKDDFVCFPRNNDELEFV